MKPLGTWATLQTGVLAFIIMGGCASAPKPEPPDAESGGKSLGWIPATEEQRDRVPFALAPLRGTLPRSVDLSARLPVPGDQEKQPSCVGWAVGYGLKSYQEAVERHATIPPSAANELFSPAFIYNQIKLPGGGASLVEALNLLRRWGAATLQDMPYSSIDDSKLPDAATKRRAERFRIDFWRRINAGSVEEAIAQLAAGFPVVIGAKVDSSFENASRGFIWRTQGGIRGRPRDAFGGVRRLEGRVQGTELVGQELGR